MSQMVAKYSADQSTSEQGVGLEVFEVTGTIKWFHPLKGYGFILPDSGPPDVLLHVNCLTKSNRQVVPEGAKIRCQVIKGPRGLRAHSILEIDESTAHSTLRPEQARDQVQAEGDWERATVKEFNRGRGYGFLTRANGGKDIFVHINTVQRCGFAEVYPEMHVQVRWGMGPKGPVAVELRPHPHVVYKKRPR